MATLYIDNRPYEFTEGQNLLNTCIGLGMDLPYFCWHPALHSVGACRQCAVKLLRDENDSHGMIVMSCMTPAKDGMRISIDDPEARRMRSGVIEFLMANHPHDCPVCDEGGECHLQDMTVMTGHAYRENRFKKRTHRNQDLGPFVNHEMNRCIACFRCVRFYRDRAGGRDLGVFGSGEGLYFGRAADGALESDLSGNLIEICPTGVFTDKIFKKHFTRKWDLESAPSVCVHCGEGCNIFAEARYDRLRRIRNRYNSEINGYFICDRGRFGFDFVNSPARITAPLARPLAEKPLAPLDKKTAIDRAAAIMRSSRGVIGIGSPRASLESNFALQTLVGPERFFQGISSGQKRVVDTAISVLKGGHAGVASLNDIAHADAVFVLGEDVGGTAPMLSYSIRQAVSQKQFDLARANSIDSWNDAAARNAFRDHRYPLFIVSPCASKLADCATVQYIAAPHDCARIGFMVAHLLNNASPLPENMGPEAVDLAKSIAAILRQAKRPAIISGVCFGSASIVKAAANIASALNVINPETMLHVALPECNSLGVSCLGGGDIGVAVELLKNKQADTVFVLENDLFCRIDADIARALLDNADKVVVFDHVHTAVTDYADIVFPASTFAESTGTLISAEARAQRYFKALEPSPGVQESWRWIRDIMRASGRLEALHWNNLNDLLQALADKFPFLSKVVDAAPSADFRLNGMKIPRLSPRSSGKTATIGAKALERKDLDAPLSYSMEGAYKNVPPALNTRYWSAGWNSVQALNKYLEAPGAELKGGDPGVKLFGPQKPVEPEYFRPPPGPFIARDDMLLALPRHHVFGSEELSAAADAISRICPKPSCVALHPADALHYAVTETETIELSNSSTSYTFPVIIDSGLPKGTAAIPAGIPGARGMDLPQWFWVRKVTADA
jgi:NADH-quinone oxidoreductase subunit G